MYIQSIFDKVIDGGFYHFDTEGSSQYMCNSLHMAARAGVISFAEYGCALHAITEYMDHLLAVTGSKRVTACLIECLSMIDPFTYDASIDSNAVEQCLPIYGDWANRPFMK